MTARHTTILRALLAGRTLDSDDATALMDLVMSGEVDDASFGAIFATLHARGETVDELAGFAESMRRHVIAAPAPADAIDTCGTGGDDAGTFNVSTCAAFVVAGTGAAVAKHGNRAVSSSCGSADVLEALGGRLETSAEHVEATFDRARFAFLFAPSFHPSMRHAIGPRRAMGVRTAFNFLGPITNPAGVRRQVVGVSDPAIAERIALVLHRLGVERALVVHGHDGLDELTIAGSSVVHDVSSRGIRCFDIAPEDAGLTRASLTEIRGGDARHNARLLRAVLDGSQRGAPRDVVLLNAAAGVVVAGGADTIAEGAALAARAIDDGAALDQLERWIAAANEEVAA